MSDKKEILMESIDILIAERLKNFKYNYYVEGVVIEGNLDGTYNIRINNEISTLYAREGLSLQVNDIVMILVINNNYSQKIIDFVRPY